jgi:hypothetical protein
VLAFVAQQAVQTYAWLTPAEMVRGLALAETTPGPLIMVQFVAFLGAYRDPGALNPWAGALLTTWVTFVPCFLFIFLGVCALLGLGSLLLPTWHRPSGPGLSEQAERCELSENEALGCRRTSARLLECRLGVVIGSGVAEGVVAQGGGEDAGYVGEQWLWHRFRMLLVIFVGLRTWDDGGACLFPDLLYRVSLLSLKRVCAGPSCRGWVSPKRVRRDEVPRCSYTGPRADAGDPATPGPSAAAHEGVRSAVAVSPTAPEGQGRPLR